MPVLRVNINNNEQFILRCIAKKQGYNNVKAWLQDQCDKIDFNDKNCENIYNGRDLPMLKIPDEKMAVIEKLSLKKKVTKIRIIKMYIIYPAIKNFIKKAVIEHLNSV